MAVLKTGARGNDVLTVQHLLAAHGHTVKTDKVFGRNTRGRGREVRSAPA
ncbi:hypothetical protein [Streptomyces filamentosus]|uniref:Uncharacterized protein n=1 Tax=Streptomyces filamentosus TaxID=67294 RepID=A0A919BNL3_STRFL|nr:hypothetical protein [Streptomyces filamentosus]GHG04037.1 hypothetical protein GCM10017667_38010 [Streptomyces filamentosus]